MATRVPGTPTISRVLDDGRVVELVYDPSAGSTFLVAGDHERIESHNAIELQSGERLVPYSASNALLTSECILLPSAVGPDVSKEELLERVCAYLHRYVDLPAAFEEIAAHYVLLSWVYDAFNDLPYLRLRGDYGTGKTRALLVIGAIAYKSFFASGASTVSPIFHIQDTFQGTLVLDEADLRFSDAAAQLTKILNNGTSRGLPVLRTMTNRNRELHPQAFRVFGPKIVAMRGHFGDLALESRFITNETGGRPLRRDIPIHLPPTWRDEARDLRNTLLAWRLRSRSAIVPDLSRAAAGLSPRFQQSSLALLSLVDDPALRSCIVEELAAEEARVLQERADTFEAAMLTAVIEVFAASPTASAPLSTIANRFNELTSADVAKPATNRWVGGFLRKRLRISTQKSHGVYVVPSSELQRAMSLAERFGV